MPKQKITSHFLKKVLRQVRRFALKSRSFISMFRIVHKDRRCSQNGGSCRDEIAYAPKMKSNVECVDSVCIRLLWKFEKILEKWILIAFGHRVSFIKFDYAHSSNRKNFKSILMSFFIYMSPLFSFSKKTNKPNENCGDSYALFARQQRLPRAKRKLEGGVI